MASPKKQAAVPCFSDVCLYVASDKEAARSVDNEQTSMKRRCEIETPKNRLCRARVCRISAVQEEHQSDIEQHVQETLGKHPYPSQISSACILHMFHKQRQRIILTPDLTHQRTFTYFQGPPSTHAATPVHYFSLSYISVLIRKVRNVW